jgi:hypothetical protein
MKALATVIKVIAESVLAALGAMIAIPLMFVTVVFFTPLIKARDLSREGRYLEAVIFYVLVMWPIWIIPVLLLLSKK